MLGSVVSCFSFLVFGEVIAQLVLHYDLFEWMRIGVLPFIITEDHRSLTFCLRCRYINKVFLYLLSGFLVSSKLLNAITIYLKLFITELILSVILISWNDRIKIKHTFIWSFQIQQIVCICIETGSLLFGAVLSLLSFIVWRKLKVVGLVFPDWRLSSSRLDWLSKNLIFVVLGFSVIWEILGVFILDYCIHVSEVLELTLSQKLKFLGPYNGYAHVFSRICNYCACQQVWVHCHEALLIETKISEKFSIFLEVLSQLYIRPPFLLIGSSLIGVVLWLRALLSSFFEDIFILK